MTRRSRGIIVGSLLLVVLASAVPGGCSSGRGGGRAGPADPGADPGAGLARPAVFSRPDLGVQVALPAGWEARPSPDFVLFLRPADAAGPVGATVSLDVPELPFHIPGLIPMGAVRSGYLDDLRKQVGPITVEDLPPPKLGDAAVRLVRSTWHPSPGQVARETAPLMVHGDRVYILRGRAEAAHEEQTRGEPEGVAGGSEPGVGRAAAGIVTRNRWLDTLYPRVTGRFAGVRLAEERPKTPPLAGSPVPRQERPSAD